MIFRLIWRMISEAEIRILMKFAWNFCWKGARSVSRFEKRIARGEYFPAFLMISITNDCTLNCRGCWVTKSSPVAELSPATLDRIISEAKKKDCSFFGILGGEPLLYDGLFDVLEKHQDCYFQVFTNGLQLTEQIAEKMRRLGNITPLVSIEGLERAGDERRGGTDVYGKSLRALDNCRAKRLVTGTAVSVCKSNYRDLVSDKFITELIKRRVHYIWYYIFRPVGSDPAPELALDDEEIAGLRRFIVDARSRLPIIIVDAYWDDMGKALCPAAAGMSHHISPRGDIEPCPPVQFAVENVGDGKRLAEVFQTSRFLEEFRQWASSRTRGCVLLECPGELGGFMERNNARDTSGRDNGLRELSEMESLPDHHQPGREIPERSFLYRFVKKRWFFGFGAYG